MTHITTYYAVGPMGEIGPFRTQAEAYNAADAQEWEQFTIRDRIESLEKLLFETQQHRKFIVAVSDAMKEGVAHYHGKVLSRLICESKERGVKVR